MDCFSSVVRSLGYPGMSEAGPFSVVPFTCGQKAGMIVPYGQGPQWTDSAVRARGLVFSGAAASLRDPKTPSVHLEGKQKPEPTHSRGQ